MHIIPKSKRKEQSENNTRGGFDEDSGGGDGGVEVEVERRVVQKDTLLHSIVSMILPLVLHQSNIHPTISMSVFSLF